MSADALMRECAGLGLQFSAKDGKLHVHGPSGLISKYSEQIKANKPALLKLADPANTSPAETPEEWLSLIEELDSLIAIYCRLHKPDDESTRRISDCRRRQPLSTIPESIAWFRQAIRTHFK